MDITVIVPLYNETESLPELAAWIDRVMKENGFSYEVLMVDDGSIDGSWGTVLSLAKEYPAIEENRILNTVTGIAIFILFRNIWAKLMLPRLAASVKFCHFQTVGKKVGG